jgi:hypothetical protein
MGRLVKPRRPFGLKNRLIHEGVAEGVAVGI